MGDGAGDEIGGIPLAELPEHVAAGLAKQMRLLIAIPKRICFAQLDPGDWHGAMEVIERRAALSEAAMVSGKRKGQKLRKWRELKAKMGRPDYQLMSLEGKTRMPPLSRVSTIFFFLVRHLSTSDPKSWLPLCHIYEYMHAVSEMRICTLI